MRILALSLMFASLAAGARAQSTPEPDEILTYGSSPSQRVEIFVPPHDHPIPVVVFVSGGCYISQLGGPTQVRPIMADLKASGIAAWSVGYRRTDEGGDFPNLFQDVGTGIDRVRAEASRLNLDLNRVIFVGHSAGGHMVLWAAARDDIAAASPLHVDHPVMPMAVVAVSAPADLEPVAGLVDQTCGDGVFGRLMGQPTPTRPDIYVDASPARMLPLDVPIRLIDGADDDTVPPPVMQAYEGQARAAGDDVNLRIVPDTDHIDVITLGEPGWEAVKEAILTLAGVDGASH